MKLRSVLVLVASVLFGSVGLSSAAEKDLVKIGGSVVVREGMVVKDAVAVGGNVTVYGEVTNDAVAVGGSVILHSGALVRGSAVAVGGEVVQPEGAQVQEDVVEVGVPFLASTVRSVTEEGWRPVWRTVQAVSFIGFLALALVLVALLPDTFQAIAARSRAKPLAAGLWGLVGLLLIVPLAVLLAVSLVGIPLIFVELLSVVLLLVFGYIGIGLLIGREVGKAFGKENMHAVVSALIGVALLGLVGWVPFLGGIVKALASLVGLGATLMVMRDWLRRSRSGRPAVQEG